MNDIASSQGFPGTGEGDILARHRHGGTGHRISIFIFPAQEFIILDRIRGLNLDSVSRTVVPGIRGEFRTSGCRSVILVSHLVLLLPDCIQGIDTALNALIVDDVAGTSLVACSRRILIGGPALELIAIPSKAKVLSRLQFHGFIVGNIFRRGFARSIVGMINQGGGRSLVAPDRIEGDDMIVVSQGFRNQQLITRQIGFVAAIRRRVPAQEYLAIRGSQRIRRFHIRIRLIGIESIIRWCLATTTIGIIYYGELCIAGVVGVEGDILGQLGVKVKGSIDVSILGSPAVPGILVLKIDVRRLILIQLRLIDGFTEGNNNLLSFTITSHGQVDGSGHARSCPLGVDRNVLRWHCTAELVRLTCKLSVIIPSCEFVVFLNIGRAVRCIAQAINAGPVLLCNRPVQRTAAPEIHLIRIAVIVEGYRVNTRAALSLEAGAISQVTCIRKSLNIIMVFFRCRPGAWAVALKFIRMIEGVPLTIILFCTSLPGQNLRIIVQSHGISPGLVYVLKGSTVQRHRADAGLISIFIPCMPNLGIIRGPLIRNICPVFGGDPQIGHLFPAGPPTTGFLIKLHRILIAVVVDIDDGGSVACNRLLGDRLRSEALILLRSSVGPLASGSGFLFTFVEGVLIIVGIFPPMEYLVLDSLPLPLGSQRHTLRQSAAEFKLLLPFEPALEGIAQAGRILWCLGYCTGSHENRLLIAAASGIKGNPGSPRHYGLQSDVGSVDRNLGDIIARSINLPAHDTLIQARGEGHIGGVDGFSILRFHSVDYLSLIIQEEDVVYLLKLGVITVSCAGGSLHRLLHKFLLRGLIIPAGELAVLLLRGLRSVDSFTGHDILGVYQLLIHKKLICINIVFVRFYHIHRRYHAVAGLTILCPDVQRQHGKHHDKCQECGEYPFC